MLQGGILESEGWRETWRPSPNVQPAAFSGQRGGQKTPSGPPGGALFLFVPEMVHCWSLLLIGVISSVKCELLSFVSYPEFILSVFVLQYCLLLGISYCVVYSVLCFQCVVCFGLVVSTCQMIGYKGL